MNSWTNVNPNQLLPSEVTIAVTKLADVLAGILETPASIGIPTPPAVPSPLDAARVVVNALLDTMSSLINGGRIHILQVPIAKTIPIKPAPSLPPTLDDLQAALDVTLGPSNTTSADAYANMVAKTGGNAGFYTAFAESLFDVQDLNRPQYEAQTDAVAMVVLLVGASSYSSILSAAATLDLLVKPTAGHGMAARTIPVPQSVTATVVGASVPPGVGVRVDWDAPPPNFTSQYFPGVRYQINRYAIIRSTDARIQRASTVLDLFPTQALTEGMTSGANKVIAIGSGKNSAYLDTDASLDPSVPQYYCVAWECTVAENNTSSTLAFNRISNVTKVAVRAPAPQQTGTDPEWSATKSAINAFPDLARVTNTLIEQARVALKPSTSPLDDINAAITLTSGASQRIAARSTELISDIERLASALSRPIPSLYVTQMSSTTGGNAYLLAELAKRLGDTTDPSRPPFDNGEYVCGVCLVAGAPRIADLAATLTFFESLFGPAGASNPLLGVLAAIDTVVTQAETAVFGPDMKPIIGGAASTVDPATGLPPIPPTPAISSAGVPVASNSPANPNAGDTNVVPTSELC